MNSRWQANKIGLVDFWYYDVEEFYFSDGRMLLRGSNGSGKSVTMQSFIPLLLDGNIRPERLDPFGSRARKMENYLLEENDGREERTGYLYMEFKRKETETYLTIGMGMRARKNKKLDTWYFILSDGRRVGEDFLLYKEVQSKVSLTKTELKNRIGEGGRVYDSQTEYMEAVNRQIFDFETIEEYKEMIDLLIQLRTPKLSKEFRPSIINEILSSSLQMLSEDDLRPMSEAIENMDGLKSNLDSLKISIEAAKKIDKIYDRYNRAVLLDKTNLYLEKGRECTELDRRVNAYDQELTACEQDKTEIAEQIAVSRQEQKVLGEEINSLNASDAKLLKNKELETAQEITQAKEQITEKDKNYESKKESRRELEQKEKKEMQESDARLSLIKENLDEMGELIEGLSFDEHTFMEKELLDVPETSYSFRTHQVVLKQRMDGIELAVETLREEKRSQLEYDERMKQFDEEKERRDKAERELNQYETLLIRIKGELTERLYGWEQGNVELKIPKEELQRISVIIEQFDHNSDYSDLKEIVRGIKNRIEADYRREERSIEEEADRQSEAIREKKQELTEWENKRESEPEVSDAAAENRKKLKEKGIPYTQFYRAVDFQSTLSDKQRNYLEEALLEMGILDALIIHADYKDAVLQLDSGLCDKYLFSDAEHVKNCIGAALEIDAEKNTIFLSQQINGALSSIGYSGGHHTSIAPDGTYRLGVLTGTITKSYRSKYIGVKAREEFKQKQIALLRKEIAEMERVCREILDRLKEKRSQLSELSEEFISFPSGEDLKIAVRDCDGASERLERQRAALLCQEERVKMALTVLNERKQQVHDRCMKIYLPEKLDVCIEANQSLKQYQDALMQLEITHHKYVDGILKIQDLRERIADIDEDVDRILYDLNRLKRDLQMREESLKSIQEQLALTNYETIRERLNRCSIRLRQLPGELEELVRKETKLLDRLEAIGEERIQSRMKLDQAQKKLQVSEEGFLEEYKLNYVELMIAEELDPAERAVKVYTCLDGSAGVKKQSELLGDLQGAFHENRADLSEYSLSLERLFEQNSLKEENPKETVLLSTMVRVDITAKYRGIKVKFRELLGKLGEDMAEQEALLSQKDRELFEDILANTVSKKIRAKIHGSNLWVEKMNALMGSMKTSSGLTLSLRWRSKTADQEEQLGTNELVELLKKDSEIMREEEVEKLSRHFRSKIEEARKLLDQDTAERSFHAIMREILDYRKWFEFQLECRKTGENKKELTDRVFFTFSGGEKAMAMYVPLFSAVVAKYQGAGMDAPRLISLDEAFAGVDGTNIKDMFRLMVGFEFDFIINSQILYGDYETVPSLAIYQLVRPENAKFISVIPYLWNGTVRSLVSERIQSEA